MLAKVWLLKVMLSDRAVSETYPCGTKSPPVLAAMPTRFPLPVFGKNGPPLPKLAGPLNPPYASRSAKAVGPVNISPLSASITGIAPTPDRIVSPVKLMAPLPVATTLDPRWQRDNWRALHSKEAQIYLGVVALRSIIGKLEAEAVGRLAMVTTTLGNPDTIENLASEIRFKIFEAGKELASARILLEASEASPEFLLAEKEFAPLLTAAAERDKADEKLRLDRQEAEAALAIAREATWRTALERAEEDPAILKATRELEQAKAAEAEL
jgi:hypothetical protein